MSSCSSAGNTLFYWLRKQMPGLVSGLRPWTAEYSQTVDPDDLVVVSAPEGGSVEPAIMLAEFVRTYRMPLIVLPKNHPGSRRFSYLVSVWPEIHTSCSIQRGTHPGAAPDLFQ